MPRKKSGVPPLRPIRQNPKPRTKLQQAFLNQQNDDLNHAETSNPMIRHFLMQRSHTTPQTTLEAHLQEHNPLDSVVADGDGVVPEEGLNAFMETEDVGHHFEGGEQGCVDPLLEALAEAHYQAGRLQNQTRWQSQYAQMLPAFLRCRLWTGNWGNINLWDHDYSPQCDCPKRSKMVRAVDLVDTLSE